VASVFARESADSVNRLPFRDLAGRFKDSLTCHIFYDAIAQSVRSWPILHEREAVCRYSILFAGQSSESPAG